MITLDKLLKLYTETVNKLATTTDTKEVENLTFMIDELSEYIIREIKGNK
jgi:hypothetical protein